MRVRLTSPLRPDGRDERSSLSVDREYTVLAIECGMYRLLNEFGEPTLHDVDAFVCTCKIRPNFWISIHNDDDDYDGPPTWNTPGYFEDWHDSVDVVRVHFRQMITVLYPDQISDLTPRRNR